MYKLSVLLLVSCFIWFYGHSCGAVIVFALVMSMGYGGIAAMTPAVAAAGFGIEGLGVLLGFLITAHGCWWIPLMIFAGRRLSAVLVQ